MSTAIADAIAVAQAAAAQAATAQAVVPTTGSQAAVAVTPGRRMTIEDFSTGMNVEVFLKVKEHGLLIGNDPDLIEEVTVEIDLSEVQITEAVKFGNPAIYLRTYDGVICVEGGTWEMAKARATQVDPKARPYKSADIPMTLVDPAKSMKGKVVAEAGKRIGHSLSTTNRGNFQSLLKDVADAGLSTARDTIQVKITSEPRINKAGNRWGVLKFELLGANAD